LKQTRKSPNPTYQWSIYRLRGTPAAYVGSVEAADEKGAIDAPLRSMASTIRTSSAGSSPNGTDNEREAAN
jgi:hypothetical protein